MAPKILIIDDSTSVQDSLQEHCSALGYEPVLASSGEEGLRLLRLNHIDLIITDILMPGMSGQDVICHVKETPSLASIPILVISGHADQELVIACIELGAEDVLTKPFIPALLHARLHACLGRSELRDMELRLREEKATEKCSRELIGALCHNFNQPLTAAMGDIQILARLASCIVQNDDCLIHEQARSGEAKNQPVDVLAVGLYRITRKEAMQGLQDASASVAKSLNRMADLIRNIRTLVRPISKDYLTTGTITDLEESTKHTVLIAGNNTAILNYAECLAAAGHSVIHASTPHEAILHARFSSPHLVVLELRTPVPEDLCEILRFKSLHELVMPVVIISEHEYPQEMECLKKHLEAIDAYICSSGTGIGDLLLARVAELLQIHRKGILQH